MTETVKIIRAKYENGVLKPLEPLELREGEEVLVKIIRVEERRKIIEQFKGILGPVDEKLLEEAIEEADLL